MASLDELKVSIGNITLSPAVSVSNKMYVCISYEEGVFFSTSSICLWLILGIIKIKTPLRNS